MYVWGIVENPKPGVAAVLEPAGLADGVSSGSVVVDMDKIVPIRICNLASSSTSLPVGTCLGILIETMEEPPDTSTAQSLSAEELPITTPEASECSRPAHTPSRFVHICK